MNDLKKTVDQALNQSMDRRQFLSRVGAVALGVVGVTAMIRSLEQSTRTSQKNGYGSSNYGGR